VITDNRHKEVVPIAGTQEGLLQSAVVKWKSTWAKLQDAKRLTKTDENDRKVKDAVKDEADAWKDVETMYRAYKDNMKDAAKELSTFAVRA